MQEILLDTYTIALPIILGYIVWLLKQTNSATGNIRNYNGLSADVAKLPHYVGDGSSALCVDTGDYYKYLKSTDTWYKL